MDRSYTPSDPDGADPEFGFKLKAFALAFTALPLALFFYLPPSGRPHLDQGSAMPLVYAVAMTLFYLRFVSWIFFDGNRRPPSWFMPPFWMCVVPGLALAIFLEEKGGNWLAGFFPQVSPPQPDFMDWFYEMRDRAQGIRHHVAPRDPYAGFGTSLVYYVFVVGMAEEAVKWLCAFTRRAATRHERAALGFAAGLGFGIAESVLYASNHYNGTAGFVLYLARFVSLVALHGCWTSLTVHFMERRRRKADRWANLHEFVKHLLPTVLLHGLYDVLVMYSLNFLALLMVAATLALFLWMLWRLEHGIDWEGIDEVVPTSDPMVWVRTLCIAASPQLQLLLRRWQEQLAQARPTIQLPEGEKPEPDDRNHPSIPPELPPPSGQIEELVPADETSEQALPIPSSVTEAGNRPVRRRRNNSKKSPQPSCRSDHRRRHAPASRSATMESVKRRDELIPSAPDETPPTDCVYSTRNELPLL
jgi:hypothetical protein